MQTVTVVDGINEYLESGEIDLSDITMTLSTGINYKFNEPALLAEIRDYIDSTYEAHYSNNKIQTTEVIMDNGHGEGFCLGNVAKYAQRYGKKGNPEDYRKDLLKIVHYGILALYNHDLMKERG